MSKRSAGIALAFAAATISGFSVFLNGFAVKQFGDPALYTTAKNLIAAALLIPIALAAAARMPRGAAALPRSARERLGVLAVGVVGGGVPFYLFFLGLSQTSSSSAAFIQKTLVVWVAVLAVALLRERFGLPHLAAITALVVGQAVAGGGLRPFAMDTGEALVFVATLFWAVEVVIAKQLLRTLPAPTLAAARMGIGVVVLVAITVASGSWQQLASVGGAQWLWAVATGIVLSAYVTTWFAALARAQAVDVTAVLVFGAVITALISSGYSGTSLLPSAIGLVLITFGAGGIAVLALRRREVTPAGG